jgi:hypothetical protein
MNLEPSAYMLLIGAHIAAVLIVLVAALRRNRGWLRLVAVLAGSVAIWLPLLILLSTLGEPNPRPPDKVLKLLGVAEDDHQLYLFVDTQPGEPTPRMYTVKRVKNKYDDGRNHVQQTGYNSLLGVKVNVDDEGNYEVVYVDYEAPDWDKGTAQRGWRGQRAEGN